MRNATSENWPSRVLTGYFYLLAGQPTPPTPPLYHTTPCGASQAPQMLNFCYEIVTKVLRKYYISVTKVLRTSNTSTPYPTIGQGHSAGQLEAGTGQLDTGYKLEAGSWKFRRRAEKSTTPKLDRMTIPATTSWKNAHQKSYCGKLEHSNIR